MNGCCGTCKYGHYDKMQGYVSFEKDCEVAWQRKC